MADGQRILSGKAKRDGKSRRPRDVIRARKALMASGPDQNGVALGGRRSWWSSNGIGGLASFGKTSWAGHRELICHILAGTLAMGTIAPASYLLFDRGPIVTISNPQINPNPTVMGEEMVVSYDAIEHRNCEGIVERVIIDSTNRISYFAPEPTIYHESIDNKTRQFRARPMVVPTGLHLEPGKTEGEATYRAYVKRWCNFMQKNFWPIAEPPRDIKFKFISKRAVAR